MAVSAAFTPKNFLLIPEWKYGNLESDALRVTCQVPFTGLCYVTNICHRPSQTPHLGVKNANPGWRRGLVRHQLLNQNEGGRLWSWPRAVSKVGLVSESWVMLTGSSMPGESRCCRANPSPASLSVSCFVGPRLQRVHHCHSLVWVMTLAWTLTTCAPLP